MTEAILVIGASGFIGESIFRGLSSANFPVLGATRTPKLINHEHLLLEEPNWLESLLAKQTFTSVIFAIGGATGSGGKTLNQHDWELFKSGVLVAQDALAICKSVIYIGSAAEYGRNESPFDENSQLLPVDQYGEAKVEETSFISSLSARSVPVTIARPSSVYGPKQSGTMLIPAAVRAAAIGMSLEIRKPLALRDFIYIEDLADAFVKMVQSENVLPPVINLGSGHEATMKEIADRLESTLGLQGRLFTYPSGGLDLGEKDILRLNSSLARKCLGWKPKFSLSEGVSHAAGI